MLYENKYGSRSNMSTSHAIIYSVQNIHKAISSKKHIFEIFIDLSKAFGTIVWGRNVWHQENDSLINFLGLTYQI